jgi:hypothetical protein
MAENDVIWMTSGEGLWINGTQVKDLAEIDYHLERGVEDVTLIIRRPLSVLTGKAADEALLEHQLEEADAESHVKARGQSAAAAVVNVHNPAPSRPRRPKPKVRPVQAQPEPA